jgi:hypothetical protein
MVLKTHPELIPKNGSPFLYRAQTVIALEDQAVLIATVGAELALPKVTGSIGIFYLRATPTDHEEVSAKPYLTIVAPAGLAPEFRVANEFGQWPVLVVRTRDLHAGTACESTQLVELRPTGPVASAPFVSAYDARGAQGRSGRSWTGQIRDVGFGGGFTLNTGERSIRFIRTDGRYVPAQGFEAPRC